MSAHLNSPLCPAAIQLPLYGGVGGVLIGELLRKNNKYRKVQPCGLLKQLKLRVECSKKLIEGEQRDATIKEFYRTKEEIPVLYGKCMWELSTMLLSAQGRSKGRFFASLVRTTWR